jgi:hypothetical protein
MRVCQFRHKPSGIILSLCRVGVQFVELRSARFAQQNSVRTRVVVVRQVSTRKVFVSACYPLWVAVRHDLIESQWDIFVCRIPWTEIERAR